MTLFRTLRSKYRAVAVLLAVALSAHGFMPMAKSAAPASPEHSLELALQIICSASGTRYPAKTPPMRPGDSCPLCPAFSAPAVVLPPAQIPATAGWVRIDVQPETCRAPETVRQSRPSLPRAPPHRSSV